MLRPLYRGAAVLLVSSGAALAQSVSTPAPIPEQGTALAVPALKVTATAAGLQSAPTVSTQIQRFDLPQTTATIDRDTIDETTNAVDTEDAIKYLPSLLVRKRNYGDTQPTLETRSWGINSSARNLVYVDDIPISALISNNNTNGAPRWGMVAPEMIEGIDMLYGPFAAEYPGNSMGGVLLITTRMPRHFEATAKQTEAFQDFSLYRTHDTYPTTNSAATIGDRQGRLSWFLGVNREDSWSQPLFFVTNGSAPTGTTGTIPAINKTGGVADVVGAGGLQHSIIYNVNGKVTADLNDWLKASWSLGYFDNDTHASSQTYLTDAAGNPTFGGVAGFATDTYALQERHLMNALSLKTDTRGHWDGELVYTRYDYLSDIQRTPGGVGTGTSFKPNGTIARLDGSGWETLDLKGIWRPTGIHGDHELSFGAHRDKYSLANPTYNTPNWQGSSDTGDGTLAADGAGHTRTYAVWAQDAWKLTPNLKLTLGARVENWQAYDGFVASGATAAAEPGKSATNISPKATLAWQIAPAWSAKLSYGQAYRYPTVSELYQIVQTGPSFSVPNPNLTPESDHSWELAIQRQIQDSTIRLSLFWEDTHNAIIQQTNLVGSSFVNVWDNVDHIRNRGAEFVVDQNNVLVKGLELSNAVTYDDGRIVSDTNFISATGTTATGKKVPYVPTWRDTVQATYRPNDDWAISLAGRYSAKFFTTLDNTDPYTGVFGAFDSFFVMDGHVHYRIDKRLDADIGIDNLLNEKYYLFHPFPGRTYIASLRLTL